MNQKFKKRSVCTLFVLLLLGFTSWGSIGMLGSGSKNYVARVGGVFAGTKISNESLNRAVQIKGRELIQKYKTKQIEEVVKTDIFKKIVLSDLINQALMIMEVRKTFGIDLSNSMIKKIIKHEERFFKDGKFSEETFAMYIRQSGMSEDDYIQSMKYDIARSIVIDPVVEASTHSDESINLTAKILLALNKQQRKVKMFTIELNDADLSVATKAPTESQVEVFYNEHKASFLIPEERTIQVVNIKNTITEGGRSQFIPSDADVNKIFTKHFGEKFTERRSFYSMLFDNELTANKAYGEIVNGGSIDSIAKKYLKIKSAKDIELKSMSKGDLTSELKNIVFGMSVGQLSRPIKTQLGFYVIKLTDIEKPNMAEINKLKAEIKTVITEEKTCSKASALFYKIEDDSVMNQNFDDLTKKFSLHITKNVRIVNGNKANNEFEKKILSEEPNIDSPLFVSDRDKCSFIMYKITNVIPETYKPLNSVKNIIINEIKKISIANLLQKQAMAVRKAYISTKNPTAILQYKNAKVNFVEATITNNAQEINGRKITDEIINEIFLTSKNTPSDIYKLTDTAYAFAVTTDIKNISVDNISSSSKPFADAKELLKKDITSETFNSMIGYLTNKYGVKVYDKSLEFSR